MYMLSVLISRSKTGVSVINLRVLLSRLYLKCVDLDWSVLVLVAAAHYFASYFGFFALGEATLTSEGVFAYYYFTTVSTVGYGDLSPTTEMGRLFFVLFVLPGGLSVFTIVLGKAIGSFSEYFRKKANGMGDYSKLEGATVIVGYHPERTSKMMAEIKAGQNGQSDNLVLISLKESGAAAGPRFVKAESLTNRSDLERAGVLHAASIVIYADNDDLTLASALAVRSLNRTAQMVCYFADAEKAALLDQHCDATVIVSSSVEMVAREITDPGSSSMISDLVSAQGGVATFSTQVPAGIQPIARSSITEELANKFGATLVSVCRGEDGNHEYDPREAEPLRAGDRVFYISDCRVDEGLISWQGSA